MNAKLISFFSPCLSLSLSYKHTSYESTLNHHFLKALRTATLSLSQCVTEFKHQSKQKNTSKSVFVYIFINNVNEISSDISHDQSRKFWFPETKLIHFLIHNWPSSPSFFKKKHILIVFSEEFCAKFALVWIQWKLE